MSHFDWSAAARPVHDSRFSSRVSGAGKGSRRLAAARRPLRPVSLKPVSSARQLRFEPTRNQLRSTRRCTRLLQRVRAGESVDRGERISDPGEIRKRRRVDREDFCSRGLACEAEVGERDRVAVAIAAGGSVFQVRFERG